MSSAVPSTTDPPLVSISISWHPTLRAMLSPVGQQVMILRRAQPKRRYGLGAVNWHTGETIVLARRRNRRPDAADLLVALLEKHPRARVPRVGQRRDAPG